jgi:hypothetical protein
VKILARLKTLISDAPTAPDAAFDEVFWFGQRGDAERRLDDRRVGLRSRADDVDRHRELSGAEQVWLAKHLAESVRFIETHVEKARETFEPATLDGAFTAWNRRSPAEREEELEVVNALGTAFGQWLVDTQGMSWVIVSDDGGADFGVTHARIGITVTPLAIAGRRMHSETQDFFSVLGRLIRREITRGAASAVS